MRDHKPDGKKLAKRWLDGERETVIADILDADNSHARVAMLTAMVCKSLDDLATKEFIAALER